MQQVIPLKDAKYKLFHCTSGTKVLLFRYFSQPELSLFVGWNGRVVIQLLR